MLVPSIAEQSEDFDDVDAANGLAYVFTNLFAICIAAFCIAGPLLELPKKDNPCTPTSTPPGTDSGGDSSGQAKQGSEVWSLPFKRAPQRSYCARCGMHNAWI